jgi:ABC-type multidrug transport system fused ATPase/permease subunit
MWRKSLFYTIYCMCPLPLQRRFRVLLFAMLILAGAETAAVGLIAFYAAAVSDPQASLSFSLFAAMRSHEVFPSLVSTPKAMIGTLSIVLIVAIPGKNALRGLITYHMARYSANLESLFGQRVLESFLARDYRWHLRQNSADLVQMVNWRHHLGRNFVGPYLKVACEVCMLLVLFLALLTVQPLVSTLFFAFQGLAGVLVYRGLRTGLDKSASGCRNREMAMNRNATCAIHGVKDVKITGTAPHFVNAFRHQAQGFANLFGKQEFWRESPLLVLESIGFMMLAAAVLFMLFVLNYSALQTTGTTALLAVTAWRSLPAFNRVVSSLAMIRTSRPYVQSLLEEVGQEERHYLHSEGGDKSAIPIPFQHRIEMRNICFAYVGDAPVLESFSVSIDKGSSLGIMGPSGCGKSTLVDILCGLLTPQSGELVVDGKVLSGSDLAAWRMNIGYVPQFPYIFDATLSQNVAFGLDSDKIDQDRVHKCCTQAGVDFLDQLPHGINSLIGERGIRLSGGQRQRIAIARALYRQPQVLILDEATSALDEEKDAEIRRLITSLKGKQTLVVVSHRPSTVKDCTYVVSF